MVSSFTIDRHEHKIEPTSMISTATPLRFYFAGTAVAAYEYVHTDANVILDSSILALRYLSDSFALFCPVRNHIIVWDLLTGSISNTLRNQSEA